MRLLTSIELRSRASIREIQLGHCMVAVLPERAPGIIGSAARTEANNAIPHECHE